MASLNPITGTLGAQRAAHLLRRATLGPKLQDISTFSGMTAQAAFTTLTQTQVMPVLPIDPMSGTNWVSPNTVNTNQNAETLSNYTRSWWMENMRSSGPNVTERMVWFYHTHFPMIMSRIEGNPQFALDYLSLLRFYALGNYKDLAKAICIDNAMLVHLDGNLNIKGVPQENFAREFLELFTVGKGIEVSLGDYTNFTEQDVQALTKALTGWGIDNTYQTIDPITNLPTGKVKGNATTSSQHDVNNKQFSGAFNNEIIQTGNITGSNAAVTAVYTELDDVIEMVFNSLHTARHICRRIYREFVYYDITTEVETDIIEPLANTLVANNYDITSVLEVLFQSEHFYDLDTPITEDNNIGAIIKSPMDLVIGTLRLFNLTVPDKTTQLAAHYDMYSQLIEQLDLQGLQFFEPYDVAGYEPYYQFPDYHRYWISSNYLANRYKFSELLISGFTGMSGNLLKLDVVEFVDTNCSNPADATILVQELVAWLFPISLDATRFNYFRDNVLLDQLSAANWTAEWANYVNTSSDVNVRLQLESLITAMMQTPEYQLF
ncbi:DUF1800 domain-containing protein [Fluviicola taffensis]|uniref:DUF1800 domain-containing protein n=1 Tax=Fluviicola taffensis (strain DSM 16823 / NCIMB 13979 / RW262) TaxID=755732 RepID=F2IGU8_FLUTR|nr:DUF1800 family protein [Fluviicola taffensis]AEA44729.1 protein of unknown function DUF1800 [Fluviicola taffensis DSM 16823]